MRAGRVRPLRASDMKKDVRILLVGERESAPCPASQPERSLQACQPLDFPLSRILRCPSVLLAALPPLVPNARLSRCEGCRLLLFKTFPLGPQRFSGHLLSDPRVACQSLTARQMLEQAD